MELVPYVVDVAQASLDDLRERLARTTGSKFPKKALSNFSKPPVSCCEETISSLEKAYE